MQPQRRLTRLWLCRTMQGTCSPHEDFSKLPPLWAVTLVFISERRPVGLFRQAHHVLPLEPRGAPMPCCSLCSQMPPSGILHVAHGVLPGLSVYVANKLLSLFLGVMCSAVPTPWGRKPPLPSWRRGGDQSRLLGNRPQLRGPFGGNEQQRGSPPTPVHSMILSSPVQTK